MTAGTLVEYNNRSFFVTKPGKQLTLVDVCFNYFLQVPRRLVRKAEDGKTSKKEGKL